MKATDPPPTDPVATADPSTPRSGLAAKTLSALRAGVPGDPQPVTPEPEPTQVVTPEPEPTQVVTPVPDAAETETKEPETGEPELVDLEKVAPETTPVSGDRDAEDADDNEGPVETKPSNRGRLSVLTAVCGIVLVASLIFGAVAGVVWWRAGHSSARKVGSAREQILVDARLAIVTVNTSDYRTPSAALANWLDVSTGALHSEFTQSRTTAVKLLAQAKMVTKAVVLDAAVTAIDLPKGTASVIASVNVTRTPVTGAVSTVRNRFRASVTRVGGEWKLSDLSVVAVALS